MKITTILFAAIALPVFAAPPEITNVRAEQREGTKLIDLWYDVADEDGDLLKVRIEVSDNNGAKWSIPAFTFTGDIGDGIVTGVNKHIVWDAGIDWDGEYSDQMRIKVIAVDAKGFPGLEWGDEVPPGGFLLGQDGGVEGNGPCRHVNIPWSYWLSKTEIVVGQYCEFLNTAYVAGKIRRDESGLVYSIDGVNLIDGMTGSYQLIGIGDNAQIRWNVNNFEVVGTKTNEPVTCTWAGAMAWANFYGYDLPTEAEWEKCARGPDFDDQDEHCLYPWGNEWSDEQAALPNGYGCYWMCGNADGEWTRTRTNNIEDYPTQENLEDSRHQCGNGYQCIVRDYKNHGKICNRKDYQNNYNGFHFGFRVCRRYIIDD